MQPTLHPGVRASPPPNAAMRLKNSGGLEMRPCPDPQCVPRPPKKNKERKTKTERPGGIPNSPGTPGTLPESCPKPPHCFQLLWGEDMGGIDCGGVISSRSMDPTQTGWENPSHPSLGHIDAASRLVMEKTRCNSRLCILSSLWPVD